MLAVERDERIDKLIISLNSVLEVNKVILDEKQFAQLAYTKHFIQESIRSVEHLKEILK